MKDETLHLKNVPVPESNWVLRTKYWFIRNSALFNLFRESLGTFIKKATGSRWLSDEGLVAGGSATGISWEDAAEITRKLIAQLRLEVEERGARFMLVTAVSNSNLDDNIARNVELLEWCQKQGISCVDTYPDFKQHIQQNI